MKWAAVETPNTNTSQLMIKIKQKRVSFPSPPGAMANTLSSVIRSNTDNMKEIVSKLERTIKERNCQIEELKQVNDILKIRNESMNGNDLGGAAVS